MTYEERVRAIEKIISKKEFYSEEDFAYTIQPKHRKEISIAIEEAIGVDFEKVLKTMAIAREKYGEVGEMWNRDGEEWSEAKAISTNKNIITITQQSSKNDS